MSTTTPTLESLAGQTTVILTSYRRDGTAVDTPVHIAFAGGRAFIRTYDKAFKTKRLRRHPDAELWRSSNGTAPAVVALARPKAAERVGAPIHVRATELSGDDDRRAAAALARKYPVLHGFLIPRAHRLQGARTINMELTAVN